MLKDREDREFDLALESKRHDEIVSLLKQLLANNNSKKDSALISAIESNGKNIDSFMEKLKQVSSPNVSVNPPNVTVNHNNQEVIKAVQNSKDELKNELSEIKELLQQLIQTRLYDTKMTPRRNVNGFIEDVTIQTVIPKPKYNA